MRNLTLGAWLDHTQHALGIVQAQRKRATHALEVKGDPYERRSREHSSTLLGRELLKAELDCNNAKKIAGPDLRDYAGHLDSALGSISRAYDKAAAIAQERPGLKDGSRGNKPEAWAAHRRGTVIEWQRIVALLASAEANLLDVVEGRDV